MSEMRLEAINLLEEISEENLGKVLSFLKNLVKEEDPFWSEENQKHLQKVIDDINNGRNISRHDLIEVE